uniref:C-C motif chemokine n=1 Tax=Sphenodon punctatus TaxID=8508 RepID=A0A8D0HBH8_SPHPU
MKVSVAALVIFFIAALCSQARSQTGGTNTPTSCCFSYASKSIPRSLVQSYYHTSSMCSQPAVIFITKKDREICADPYARWTKEYIKHLGGN